MCDDIFVRVGLFPINGEYAIAKVVLNSIWRQGTRWYSATTECVIISPHKQRRSNTNKAYKLILFIYIYVQNV